MNTVRVHRWISKKEQISYTFGHASDNPAPDIPIVIFQDDSLNKALTKIALGIQYYHTARNEPVPSIDGIPYIWTNKKSLRFEFPQSSVPIPVNPWDNLKTDAPISQILYNQDSLFMKTSVNIVFKNDISTSLYPYYFPDAKVTWKPSYTLKEFVKESDALYNLWNISKNEPDEHRPFIYSKLRFVGHAKVKATSTTPLSVLFKNMHTSERFPFIQYIEDSSKILYKVWKRHSITAQLLQNWSYYERLPKVEMIVIMVPLEREHTYARATLDSSGQISVQYQIDSRDKVSWDVIELYTKRIKNWFETHLLTSISLNIESISGKGEFASQGITIQDVSKTIGKGIFIPIYHVIRVQDGVLHAAFKRSKNYHSQIDISDYISSNIKLGIPLQEIAQDLIDLGMTQKEVFIWIEQYQTQTQDEADIPKKKTLAFTGCVFKIEKNPYGFRVIMENVATLEELKYIYHWVRSTFKYIAQENTKKKPVAPPVVPPPVPPPVLPPPPVVPSAPPQKSSAESSQSEEDIFGQELDLSGGAGKKGQGTDRYFLSQLQQNDPAIFLDTKNYARLCAANNFRQPIVVSPQEKEKIDREGYSTAYDDSIHYGSDQNHMNHYMCPRIWCPTARIPLTEKQLEDNGGRCPGPTFEKPMKLYENKYWDNNPKIKHHIGFHKQKTPAGLCLPCCMKNPLKEREVADCKTPSESVIPEKDKNKNKGHTKDTTKPDKPPQGKPGESTKPPGEGDQSVKEEGYIMGATAPLPVDRYGALPKDLHTFLQPKVPYQLCSKTISSTECYLRKGIQHYDDSLLNAIALSIGLSSKKELIKKIIEHLDPISFISLSSGHILYAFMDKEPIVSKDKRNATLLKHWTAWIKTHPRYAKLVGLSGLGVGMGAAEESVLSRELAIFKAYSNFIEYLQSSDTKNPEHIQEVLLKMGIILLIWKRQDNVATLQCPTYSSVEDIFDIAKNNKKIAMILQENEYYEPIELKQRGRTSVALFEQNGALSKELQKILEQCPSPNTSNRTSVDETTHQFSRENASMEGLRSLIGWSKLRLFSPSPFQIQSLIIRQDFTIYGFLTKCNLLIRGPQEGLLIHILDELFDILPGLKHIIHLEDIANTTRPITEMYKNDFVLFHNKVQDLGFTLHSGNIPLDAESLKRAPEILDGLLTFEPVNLSILPFILTRVEDRIWDNEKERSTNDKKWYELEQAVGSVLLKNYETLVAPLLIHSRKERIRILMNTFRKNPEKQKIQAILEEIPLEYGKDELVRWIRSIGLEKRARIYTSSFVQNDKAKKEWVFSQAAVEYGLPKDILKPVDSIHPNEKFTSNRIVEYQKKNEESDTRNQSPQRLPILLQKGANTLQSLPSKWNQIKTYSWNQYSWYKMTDTTLYSREGIPELFEWIANTTGIPFRWNDTVAIRNKVIIGLLKNKDKATLLKLFEDPAFIRAWVQKRKYKDADDIWKTKLEKTTPKELISQWQEIFTTCSNEIWPMDIDFKITAELMNISILVIYRGKYGEGKDAGKRGDIDDLAISSTFYHADDKKWNKRPCVIFYRTLEKDRIVFSPIVHNDDDIFIHRTTESMPKDIQDLLKYHLEKESQDASTTSTSNSS
jgi:hypothetical protein